MTKPRNASTDEELALPSNLPSKLTPIIDSQQEKTPNWRLYLYSFFGERNVPNVEHFVGQFREIITAAL